MSRQPPVVLTIAGSDNSAGAGAQADLKTFAAHGAYGLTAITCVVAEVPGKVSAIQPIEPRIVREQIALCFDAFPVAAVKTGMLHSREIIEEVLAALDALEKRPPIVVDPVMVATSGDRLLRPDAVALYEQRVFPLATVVTPNLDEVAALLGRGVATLEEMRAAARELASRHAVPFLVKGGHLRGEQAVDLLVDADGEIEFEAPFVPNVSTHGTGCTYSAAIAAGLAQGLPLREAVRLAKDYVTAAIRESFRWPRAEALNHGAPEHRRPA